MLILFACFLEKAPVGSLSLVAHGRHFTLQLSALLICFEWSWLCSKRACGFPHLWLFAVVSALSESPSVQEEPEQFSHSIFSPPLLFPWHSPGFHLQPMLFFKCMLKALYSPSFFHCGCDKKNSVYIKSVFPSFSLSHLLYLFLQVCFQTSLLLSMSQQLSAIHGCQVCIKVFGSHHQKELSSGGINPVRKREHKLYYASGRNNFHPLCANKQQIIKTFYLLTLVSKIINNPWDDPDCCTL